MATLRLSPLRSSNRTWQPAKYRAMSQAQPRAQITSWRCLAMSPALRHRHIARLRSYVMPPKRWSVQSPTWLEVGDFLGKVVV